MKNIIFFISFLILTGCFSSRNAQKYKVETKIETKVEEEKEKETESNGTKDTEYNSETVTDKKIDTNFLLKNIPGAPSWMNDELAKNPVSVPIRMNEKTTKKENIKTQEKTKVKEKEKEKITAKVEEKKKESHKVVETTGMPWYLYLLIGMILAVAGYFAYRTIRNRIL